MKPKKMAVMSFSSRPIINFNLVQEYLNVNLKEMNGSHDAWEYGNIS